jgi:hypothetical protein
MKAAIRNRLKVKLAHKPLTDASGHEFDPSRHVSKDDLTAAGTFRLKRGKRHTNQ